MKDTIMEMTLTALVQGALSEADAQLKLASAQDVVPDPIKLAMEGMPFGKSDGDDDDGESSKKKSKKKKDESEGGEDEGGEEEKTSCLALAQHAMKLAEAVDHVGVMWAKQADEMQTFEGQHNVGDNTQHSKTSPASLPAAQASHGGGPSENSQGYPNGIDTNASEFKTPEWKSNPEAREGAIRVKGAKPGETSAGKTASLAGQRAVLGQFGAKFAADPSSPQATGLTKGKDPGKLDMVPPRPTEIPANEGMAGVTKKKAKTPFVKSDAAKVLSEPAFSGKTDRGIKDNLSQVGGNKFSSLQTAAARTFLKKVASSAGDPHASPQMRVKTAKFQQAVERIKAQRAAG